MDPDRRPGPLTSAPAHAQASGEARRGLPWRRSIRGPIAAAVIAANVLSFAVIAVINERAASLDREAIEYDYSLQLSDHLDAVVDGLGRLRPAEVLDWSGWRYFDDVIVAQAPERRPDGTFDVAGVYLNPLGRAHRPVDFEEDEALAMMALAIESRALVSNSFGAAAPVLTTSGTAWGAAWFKGAPIEFAASRTRKILPVFLLVLAGVTLSTLVLIRRTVLDPVAGLARAAGRLEAGDLSARARERGRQEDELGGLVRTFNAMAVRLERYNRDLEVAVQEATDRVRSAEAAAMTQRRLAATGELAAGIAHELNNPLGGLANAVEALKREDLPEERRQEYLQLVSGGLQRMGETVGRLLRLSPREATLGEVEVDRPLSDALGLIRHRAEQIGVAVELHLRSEEASGPLDPFLPSSMERLRVLPRLQGAANELGQAFLNLLVNSLDAIEEGRASGRIPRERGRIRLELGLTAGGSLELVFEDDGPGVPAEVLERAADPFFTTKEQGKGTGLGLAMVHNVIAAHGGRVLVSSEEGEGFRVAIEMPLERAGDSAT